MNIDKLAEKHALCRTISQTKTEVFSIPCFSPFTGELTGYQENDEHFKMRINMYLKDHNIT